MAIGCKCVLLIILLLLFWIFVFMQLFGWHVHRYYPQVNQWDEEGGVGVTWQRTWWTYHSQLQPTMVMSYHTTSYSCRLKRQPQYALKHTHTLRCMPLDIEISFPLQRKNRKTIARTYVNHDSVSIYINTYFFVRRRWLQLIWWQKEHSPRQQFNRHICISEGWTFFSPSLFNSIEWLASDALRNVAFLTIFRLFCMCFSFSYFIIKM